MGMICSLPPMSHFFSRCDPRIRRSVSRPSRLYLQISTSSFIHVKLRKRGAVPSTTSSDSGSPRSTGTTWRSEFDSIRDGVGWFFDLFTMNAKADALTVDSTTVALVDPAAASCTTSQSAAAGDNAVLVMLSNRGPTAYTSVTYGSASLSLIPGTATSGTGIVRTEMWFYQGVIPGGAQTMTATLVSGTAKQVCATVLLGGVWATTPTGGGT